MNDLNPTTRKYPRTLNEAFPETTQHNSLLESQQSVFQDEKQSNAEFWVYMTLAFAAGFLVHLLWGAK